MTFPPDHPDPKHSGEPHDLPELLLGDLRQAYPADEVQPPSRVDEAVFAAASKHFAAQKPVIEPKTGVLGWVGQRPLRSAGLGGALLAASVLMVVLIVSPNQQTPGDRSVAMDSFLADESLPAAPTPFADLELQADRDSARGDGRSLARLREPSAPPSNDMIADQALELAPRSAMRPIVRGDVNGDGIVTIADALLLARMTEAAGGTLDDPRFDLLGDGTVTRADADAIARLVVRLAPAPNDTPNPEGAS